MSNVTGKERLTQWEVVAFLEAKWTIDMAHRLHESVGTLYIIVHGFAVCRSGHHGFWGECGLRHYSRTESQPCTKL